MIYNSTGLELIFATVVIVVVAIIARRAYLAPERMNLFDLALLFYGIYFGFGPWVAFFYGGGTLPQEPAWLLVYSYTIIISFLFGLWLIGAASGIPWNRYTAEPADENRFGIATFIQRYQQIGWTPILITVGFVWTIRLIRALSYGMWISGSSQLENMLSMPYYFVIFDQFAVVFAFGYLLWSSVTLWVSKGVTPRMFSLCILACEFGWAFLRGRRWMLLWLVFVFFGFLASGRKIRLKHLLVAVFMLAFSVTSLFPLFFSFRHIYFSEKFTSDNPIEKSGDAILMAFEERNQVLDESLAYNMSTRPLGCREFICRIREGLDKRPPMMGKALVSSIVYTIPSALYPKKYKQLAYEQSVQDYYRLPLHDTASNWPAAGCADFDLAGGVIAGLIVGIWIVTMQWWALQLMGRHPIISLVLFGTMLATLIQVEAPPTVLWAIPRNILILLIMAMLFSIFKFRRGPTMAQQRWRQRKMPLTHPAGNMRGQKRDSENENN